MDFDDPVMAAPMKEETDALVESITAEPEVAPFEGVEHLLDLNMRTFRSADEPDATYFELRISRAPDAELPVLPRDVVLLVDGSESMTQRRINACKQGLKAVVDELSDRDRLEILTFRDSAHHAFGEMRPATRRNRAEARAFIDRLVAQGRTDIDAGLDALQTLNFQASRPVIVMLVTDGRPTAGVVNSSQIIERFTAENQGRISVFSMGLGRQVNQFLLDLLSYRNRGDLQIVEDNRAIARALAGMHRDVARPVLADLRFRFSGVSEGEVYPRTLTHLYLDRPLTVYGRFVGAAPSAALQIVGRSGPDEKDMVFPLRWEEGAPGDARLRQQWAWQKIYDLIGLHLQSGQDEVLDEVHAIADRYGLRVPYGRDEVYLY
jgi:Ca-activated chloride channel family protein